MVHPTRDHAKKATTELVSWEKDDTNGLSDTDSASASEPRSLRAAEVTTDSASPSQNDASAEEPGTDVIPGTLDLVDVIQQAFHSNPEVSLAVEGTRAARAAQWKATREFQPSVTATTGYGISDIPLRAFSYRLNQGRLLTPTSINRSNAEDDMYAQVSLQKDIYDGGKRVAQARATDSLRRAASHDVCAARNEIAFRVAQAYYGLLKANDLLKVRRQAVQQIAQHLKAVRTRIDAGSAVKVDELAIVVRLAQTQDAVVVAENQLELTWAELDRIVGTPVPRAPLPATVPTSIGLDELESMEEELLQALKQRPEISRHRHQQRAAANRVDAARAVYAPRVQFIGDYEVHTGDFLHGEDGYYVGMLASLNLFDGGRGDGAIAQANSSFRQKQIEYERLRLDIDFEIRQAKLNLNAAIERLALAEQSVEEAEEVLRSVELQYEAEASTLIRLVDAQVLAADARNRQASSHADVEIARMDLARALGMLHSRFLP